jgi:hypothetical protein
MFMEQRKHFPAILASGLAGFITALAISITLYQNDLSSIMDWGIALSLLTFGFGFIYFMCLPYAWKQFSESSRPAKFWAVVLAVISAICFSIAYGYLSFIAFLFAGFVLVSGGLSPFQELISQKRSWRFIFAWALGGVIAFFMLGFFQNFYPSRWEFVLFTVFLNLVFTLVFEIILEWAGDALQKNIKEKLVSIVVLAFGLLLVILMFSLLVQYPTLFATDFFLPDPHLIPAFLGLAVLSQSWTAFILQKLDSTNWRTSPFILWIKRNLPGLLLASAISISTYALATVFVSADLRLADNYFDTDSPIWINFLTADSDQVVSMRAVHPYVLMMLRPQVWLLSLLLHGNKFHAALLLNSFVGGLCVFLTWLFFKERTRNTAYALIIAFILGLSNSHLLLSSFLESYIFSAAILITAVLLLQNENTKLIHIVPVGLAALGITITNFIQTCIIFLFTQRDIKKTFKYMFITIALAVVVTFIQTLLQPNSHPFYVASNLGNESAFKRDIIDVPLSETASRANVITRTITLFSVVAPRPLILLEEIGCSTPCFNTIRFFRGKYQYASYIGFGSWLARAWFAILLIAGLIFAWNLIKSPRKTSLQAALALNLLFNFVLHMNYGDDPMLYSPNWTYALVFFFGISFEKFADKKWIQIVLLIFLMALLFNNIELFHKMLDAILPILG